MDTNSNIPAEKKVVSVEILHLDELGYGPRGEHTRRDWRNECLNNLVSGQKVFEAWQENLTTSISNAQTNKSFECKFFYDDGSFLSVAPIEISYSYDFVGQTFDLDIEMISSNFIFATIFNGANFNGLANFRESKFNKVAHFQYVSYKSDAYFNDCTFESHAYFPSNLFNRDGSFGNITVYGNAVFANSTFVGNAYFSKVIFHFDANFNNTFFKSISYFEQTTFNKIAYFSACIFFIDSSFKSVIFNDKTTFIEVNFKGNAFFNEVKFADELNFSNAIFNMKAVFDKVNYGGVAIFNKCSFILDAIFSKNIFNNEVFFLDSEFSKTATFNDSIFEGIVYFTNSTFSQSAYFRSTFIKSNANFSKVHFKNQCRFDNEYNVFTGTWERETIFFHEAVFENAIFDNVGHFDRVKFFSSTPNFRGCKIAETRLEFSEDGYFPHGEQSEEAIKNISFLKRLADEHGQTDQALNFNAMELRSKLAQKRWKIKDLSFIKKIKNADYWYTKSTELYDSLSDFGRSFTQPLKWYLVLLLITFILAIANAIVFSAKDCENEKWYLFSNLWRKQITCTFDKNSTNKTLLTAYRAATEYTIYRAAGILDFSDNGKGTEAVAYRLFGQPIEPWWMRVWGVFKAIASTALLFLAALGLRNKYRIK